MIVGCFRGEAASPLIEIFTAKKGLIGKPQTVIHFCFILFRRAPAAREELSGIVQPALHVRISKRKRTPPSLVMVMLRPHWLKTPGRRAGPVLETIENALRADQAKDDGC